MNDTIIEYKTGNINETQKKHYNYHFIEFKIFYNINTVFPLNLTAKKLIYLYILLLQKIHNQEK